MNYSDLRNATVEHTVSTFDIIPTLSGMPESPLKRLAYSNLERAPYPNDTIAMAAAFALISGMSRGYTISGQTPAIMQVVSADTGLGKEAGVEANNYLLTRISAPEAVPAAAELRGPSSLVSEAGLTQALASRKFPAMLCHIHEFGLFFQQLTSPRRDARYAGLEASILNFTTKNSPGNAQGDTGYADKQKNPGIIYCPHLVISGDATHATFDAALNIRMVQSGLLPRMIIWRASGKRPYLNKQRKMEPPAELLNILKNIASQSLRFQHQQSPREVRLDNEAEQKFDEFERYATDYINSTDNDVAKMLFSRMNVKALNIAALIAISRNSEMPTVALADCLWATTVIVNQTWDLISKFANGEVGGESGTELKQQDEVIRVMRECLARPFAEIKTQYGGEGTEILFALNIVTHQYLQRRLLKLPVFNNEQLPPQLRGTAGLKRVLEQLCHNGKLEFLSSSEAKKKFNRGMMGYRFAQGSDELRELEKTRPNFFPDMKPL